MRIIRSIDNFYKIASLLSDMAHRSMFAIISSSEGFDFPTARIAAVGAKNIAYYGIKSIQSELNSYDGRIRKVETRLNESDKQQFPSKKYLEILDNAKNIFNDVRGFEVGWGGLGWKEIAECLIDIVNLYDNWRKSKRDSDEEMNAINSLIIKMNLFDSLVHNNASVYDKMVLFESGGGDHKEKAKKIMELRDLSESQDLIDFYKEIEKHIDIALPYKDFMRKMRSHPEYRQDTEARKAEHVKQIKEIRQTQISILSTVNMMIKMIMDYKETVDSLKNKISTMDNKSIYGNIRDIKETFESANRMLFDQEETSFNIILSRITESWLQERAQKYPNLKTYANFYKASRSLIARRMYAAKKDLDLAIRACDKELEEGGENFDKAVMKLVNVVGDMIKKMESNIIDINNLINDLKKARRVV